MKTPVRDSDPFSASFPSPAQQDEGNSEQEIDLGLLWERVRRQALWIVFPAVLLGIAVFLWSRALPNVYEASASMVTSGAGLGAGRDYVVTASPLPAGALQEALQGPLVMGNVIRQIGTSTALTGTTGTALQAKLQRELQKRSVRTIRLQTRLDPAGNGIYTVTVKAPSAQSATVLADITVQAILGWDRSRALSSVERAERSLTAQVAEVDRQLGQPNLGVLDRQTLVTTRATLQQGLAQAGIQRQGVTGSLELLSPAVQPLDPVAPRPLRNSALTTMLVLLLGIATIAMRTILDRTARGEDDLLTFGLPTLGTIPALRRRDVVLNGIVRAARETGLYEAIGFLRVNLLTRIGTQPGQVVMITSTTPGEGKSSVTATLADGLVASGMKVLIIDADLRRGTQQDVWDKYEREHSWLQLTGTGGSRTLQNVIRDPDNVQVFQTDTGVHVLPAGEPTHDTLEVLNRIHLGERLEQWNLQYDLILIDSPPLLALADALVIGRFAQYTLLVVEEGRTSMQAIRHSLRRARNSNLTVLGFVLNKAAVGGSRSYSYTYTQTPQQHR